MDRITALPFVWAFSALFVIVLARSNATYWVGRAVAAGGRKTRAARFLDSAAMTRAELLIARWGAAAVAVSFLAIGFQTAVNASAGLGRMPLRRYIPATVAGSILWALVYASIGLAAFEAAVSASAGSPAAVAALAACAVVVLLFLVFLRRRRALRAGRANVKAPAAR